MAKATFGKTIIRLGSVTSTQDILKESFQQGVAEGALAIADEQTLGKGRQGRTWDSAAGKGLWVSVLIEPTGPDNLWTWTPLWAGIIARNAILTVCGKKKLNMNLLLKWPNDLLLDDFKLGGILTERVQNKSGRSAVIVGMGINLKQRSDEFPPHLKMRATSLLDFADIDVTPDQLLECLIEEAEQNVQLLKPVNAKAIEKVWLKSAWGLNQKLQIVSGSMLYEGKFTGLGPHGEMKLTDPKGSETLIASSDGIGRVNG